MDRGGKLMDMMRSCSQHLCSQGHTQQTALGQALQQLRGAVSGEQNGDLEMHGIACSHCGVTVFYREVSAQQIAL